jgi:tRNA uridine 5-carboxymethylaminomethyl modification enzyme
LEDKVIRFPQKDRHQIFLEPEGVDAREIYVNGFSMSLPRDVQEKLVHALPGLEEAEILRPGYAIEYDFIHPVQLRRTLETRRISGLFLAGQINGTSGYEEAASQGIVAGINAARSVFQQAPFELRRDEAYIGILIDDLITRGCLEPYRMFTSRAEHRLLLRIDNADLRLTPKGRDVGLVDDERWHEFSERRDRLEHNLAKLETTRVRTSSGNRVSASQLLRQPEMRLDDLIKSHQLELLVSQSRPSIDLVSCETTVKYTGYLRRQEAEVERARRDERRRIPADFNYEQVPGLSREIIQRLGQIQPDTIGQALRIPGVTPAAAAVLSTYIRR